MRLPLLIEVGQSRFVDNQQRPVPIPAITEALGFPSTTVIGTYDHLRSPISNRILSGDERFSRLCSHLGAHAVLLVLDCTMVPSSRPRNTHVGFTMGFSDFFAQWSPEDALDVDPKCYFSFQAARPLPTLPTLFWDRVRDALVNLQRRDGGAPRDGAFRMATRMVLRGQRVASLYSAAFSAAYADDESVAKALLNLRSRIRAYTGMCELPDGLRIVLYSNVRQRIACALEHFMRRFGRKHAFWSAFKQFTGVSPCGRCLGTYVYDPARCEFVLPRSESEKVPIGFVSMPSQIAKGTAAPTTSLLYALLHLAGGIPHFGDSHDMNSRLGAVLGVLRPAVDITPDGTNSVTVGTITANVGGRETELRNVSSDLMWYEPSHYGELVERTIASGMPSFHVDLADGIPDS